MDYLSVRWIWCISIVGVLLVAWILIFGGAICIGGIGCGLCCVVFYWFLHLVRIMVQVEMYLKSKCVLVDGVLIQCVSLVCRSLSAFLLSACMSVWSMPSICM